MPRPKQHSRWCQNLARKAAIDVCATLVGWIAIFMMSLNAFGTALKDCNGSLKC